MSLMKKEGRKGIRSVFKMKGEPQNVAKGFALGSFVGMLPFPGFQMLISAGLAIVFRYNKAAAIAGVFNTNLATGAFVFAFNYWLGRKILGFESGFEMPDRISLSFARTIIEAGSEVFLSLLLGGLISGVVAMFLGYYISVSILNKRKKNEGIE